MKRFWFVVFWAWAALGLFELLLPLYGRALGVSTTTVGWLFGVFSFTGLLLRLVLGRLLDRIPRRPVLVAGLALYLVVFGIFAVAQTVELLIVARLLQGLASTAVWLTAAVMVAEWAPPGQQAYAFGRYQVISVWGAVVGASWGGTLLGLLDAETRTLVISVSERFDIAPLLAWLPAPWQLLDVLHLVFAGNAVCMLVALVLALRLVEPARTPPPVAPVGTRPALVLGMVGLVSGVATGLLLPVLVLVVDDRFGLGGAGVGIVYAIPGIVYGLAPAALGRLADRWGHRTAAMAGLLCVAVSHAAFPFAPSVIVAIGVLCIEAIGMSLANPALLALVGGGQAYRIGSAYGWYTTASLLGVALGSPVGGWLYDQALPAPFVAAALCMAGAAVVLRMRRGTARRDIDPVADAPYTNTR